MFWPKEIQQGTNSLTSISWKMKMFLRLWASREPQWGTTKAPIASIKVRGHESILRKTDGAEMISIGKFQVKNHCWPKKTNILKIPKTYRKIFCLVKHGGGRVMIRGCSRIKIQNHLWLDAKNKNESFDVQILNFIKPAGCWSWESVQCG